LKIRDLIEETKEHGIGMMLLIQYSNYLDNDVEEELDNSGINDWFWNPLRVRFNYYRERERIKFSKKIRGEI